MRENTIFLPIAVLLILFTSSFGLVVVASAQTRTVGVSVGNKFRYSNTVNWSSNNPNATPPFDVVTSNKTEWFELTVMDISGTNISCQQLTHLKNGTEITVNNWVDIDTGNGNLTLFTISANLAVGSSVYTSSSLNNLFINETMPRTYLSSVRDANHLNMTSSTVTSSYNVSESINMYWDKSTGVLVDELVEDTTYGYSSGYTTRSSTHMQIISSNVWTVIPEFPNWTLALLGLIAVTATTFKFAKLGQNKRPFN